MKRADVGGFAPDGKLCGREDVWRHGKRYGEHTMVPAPVNKRKKESRDDQNERNSAASILYSFIFRCRVL
jgi:hypothetical protein